VVFTGASGDRLLDHVERELSIDTLLIADPAGALAVAGVMGGATSEVSDATSEVVIESAVFDAVSIRRTAQRLALRSEASSRFEKGQEARLARLGADRTAQLVRAWAGGEVAPGRVDTAPEPTGRGRSARPRQPARHGSVRRAARPAVARGVETEPAAPGIRSPLRCGPSCCRWSRVPARP
jgi:phenylalanyl-tRNA synthetase beta chain